MKIIDKISVAVISALIASIAEAHAKPVIVAVLDTGINEAVSNSGSLCKYGHKDFTNTSISDIVGHGSHISGLIDQYVKDTILVDKEDVATLRGKKANYCQVIVKFLDPRTSTAKSSVVAIIKALRWAIDLKVDVINISAGGAVSNKQEQLLIKKALDKGIKVVVAAGNEGCELGGYYLKTYGRQQYKHKCTFYPAMYDNRLTVVGSVDKYGIKAPHSNYGSYVNNWEWGVSRISYGKDQLLEEVGGTSQATAVKTGKIIRSMLFSQSSR